MTAFELGFISKCAEYGLDGRQVLKSAAYWGDLSADDHFLPGWTMHPVERGQYLEQLWDDHLKGNSDPTITRDQWVAMRQLSKGTYNPPSAAKQPTKIPGQSTVTADLPESPPAAVKDELPDPPPAVVKSTLPGNGQGPSTQNSGMVQKTWAETNAARTGGPVEERELSFTDDD